MTDPPARIPQLTPEQWSDEAREVFSAMGSVNAGQPTGSTPSSPAPTSQSNHVLRTFAQYPALAKPWLSLNGYLLSPAVSLPVRLRQLAIQRVAWIRHCRYMWSSHLRVSLALGLTRDDIEAIKIGSASPYWSEAERTLVSAVEDLVQESAMSDESWAGLSIDLDDRALMDLVFIVGCYTSLTMVMNSLLIQREPELLALAAEYGEPTPP